MRVLVIEGTLLDGQAGHWEAVSRTDVDLHLVGTLFSIPGRSETVGAPPNATVHLLEPRGWRNRDVLWWLYPGLRNLVTDLNPDLIHVCSEPWALFYTQVANLDPPVIGHGAEMVWSQGMFLERGVRLARARRVLSRLGGFAAWNAACLERARRYGLKENAPTLIAPTRLPDPMPFRNESANREPHRAQLGIGNETAIGFVGRLAPEKGAQWLIEAMRPFAPDQVSLFIFGAGAKENDLRASAAELKIRVEFPGAIAYSKVPSIMAAMDVIVVPSLTTPTSSEQFGRVALEAMFANTALVVSDSGALPEVVGEAALIVGEGDVNGLSEAIALLIDDPERRRQLANAASSRASARYTPDVVADSLVEFWQAVLAS